MNFSGTVRLNRAGILIFGLLIVLLILYFRSARTQETFDRPIIKAANVKVNLKKLLISAIKAAELGGKQVKQVYMKGDLNEKSKGKTFEGANDPVTDADKRSHCVMYYTLGDQFPDINIISEEVIQRDQCKTIVPSDSTTTSNDLAASGIESNNIEANAMHAESVNAEDVTVWIDPLDATQEFTEKLLEYVTTMVCVAVKGVPIMGVIHKPFGEVTQTFWAWNQRGMSSSLLLLKHSANLHDDLLSIIVSRSHAGKVKSELESKLGTNIEIIPAGGAGYKSLEVAASNVSAYIHSTKIKKWDICAGDAILRSLGGGLVTLKGETIDYNAHTNVVNSEGVLAYKTLKPELEKTLNRKSSNS